MTTRFADTYYYLALLDSSDQHHSKVLAHARRESERHVTTRWVMAEVADALAAPRLRQSAARLLARLENDPDTIISAPTDELFLRGLQRYSQRTDKEWSLTDCFSFVVMEDLRLSEVLTGDRHFAQAGFTALFAD